MGSGECKNPRRKEMIKPDRPPDITIPDDKFSHLFWLKERVYTTDFIGSVVSKFTIDGGDIFVYNKHIPHISNIFRNEYLRFLKGNYGKID